MVTRIKRETEKEIMTPVTVICSTDNRTQTLRKRTREMTNVVSAKNRRERKRNVTSSISISISSNSNIENRFIGKELKA